VKNITLTKGEFLILACQLEDGFFQECYIVFFEDNSLQGKNLKTYKLLDYHSLKDLQEKETIQRKKL